MTSPRAVAAGREIHPRGRGPRPLLRHDLCDEQPGTARRAAGEAAGARPEPAADGAAGICEDGDRRMAGELPGVLRAGDRLRLRAGRHRLPHGLGPAGPAGADARRGGERGHGEPPGGRTGVGGDRRVAGRRAHRRRRWRSSRIGFLGHTYPGMLDLYSDFTQISGQPGRAHRSAGDGRPGGAGGRGHGDGHPRPSARRSRRSSTISEDSPSDPLAKKPKPEEMEWACRVAVGLDALARDFDLQGLAYYHRGVGRQRSTSASARG